MRSSRSSRSSLLSCRAHRRRDIIESIFSLPGMGNLMFEALEYRDNPVIMGITVLAAIVTLLSYLMADILYVVVDPRISFE